MTSGVASVVRRGILGRPPAWPGTIARWLPALVFLVCSTSADLVAIAGHDPIGIWSVLPAGPVSGSWINAEVSSTTLLLVAIALFRGKRVGWWLALALLGAAVYVQGVMHQHPIAAAVALVVGVILVGTRRRYVARTGTKELLLAAGLIGVGAVAVLLDAAGSGAHRTELLRVGRLVGLWLDAGAIGRIHLGTLTTIALVGARIAFLAAMALSLDPAPDPRSPRERAVARATLERVGRGSLLPYQLGPVADAFADSEAEGAVAFARAGRAAVMLGDASGFDSGAANRAFEGWVDAGRVLDWQPSVYQASEAFAAELRDRGWHVLRIGKEAILDPVEFDLGSARLANVRHTVTRARKGGLSASSSRHGTHGLPAAGNVTAMAELDAEWRRAAGPRLGFTVGQLDPSTIGGTITAVAIDRDDRLQAFVVLRPTGADGGWMLDVMRRRRGGAPGAVPGAVELSLVTAIGTLAEMSVRRFSLGLAPLAGLRPGDGPLDQRLLAVLARAARPVYDVAGLTFYKDKFGVTWEPRYLAVPTALDTVGAAVALVRLHLGGSWVRVARSLVEPLAGLLAHTGLLSHAGQMSRAASPQPAAVRVKSADAPVRTPRAD